MDTMEAVLWADLDVRRESIGATSVHTAFRAWRTFALWAQAEGYVEKPVKLPKIRKPKPVPEAPSVDNVRGALQHFRSGSFVGLRNAVINGVSHSFSPKRSFSLVILGTSRIIAICRVPNEWEIFVVLEDADVFRSEISACCGTEGAGSC